jgi:hypothetical protein
LAKLISEDGITKAANAVLASAVTPTIKEMPEADELSNGEDP